MTTLNPISLNPSSALTSFYSNLNKKLNCFKLNHSVNICSFHGNEFQFKYFNGGIRREEKRRRVVKVRLNQFNGGDGGGDDGNNGRVLGNLALAVGLTYLTFTGQLGWVFDTIVNIGFYMSASNPQSGLQVEGNDFVSNNSNQSSAFGETFNGFSSSSRKERASSLPVVDIEAEVTDVE